MLVDKMHRLLMERMPYARQRDQAMKMILEPAYNDYDESELSWRMLRGGRRIPGTSGVEHMSIHVCRKCGGAMLAEEFDKGGCIFCGEH